MGCYFDDIQIVNVTGIDSSYGQGPTCSGAMLDNLKPPGVSGYSDSVISELSTLLTAGRLDEDSKKIIHDVYDAADTANDGLVDA